MIYEYPEEFVVSVAYVDKLSDKPMHRDWELEYMQIDGVLIPNKKTAENKDIIMNDYEDKVAKVKEKKSLGFEEELLNEPYQKNMLSYDVFEDGLKDNHVKKIFKDIDNEYAESEVSMRNGYEI